MKERLKNWITTGIGLVIIIGSLSIYLINKIDATELGIALTLRWTYLSAKDSLLQGITGGIIKKEVN